MEHAALDWTLTTGRGDAQPAMSIIVPSLNTAHHLARCVERIRECTAHSFELIIVDQSSTDRSVEMATEAAAGMPIVWEMLPAMAGFAGACNAGARRATGKALCFLNSDCLVTKGWDVAMLGALQVNLDLGAVGPMSNNVSRTQRDPEARYDDDDGMQSHANQRYARFGRGTWQTEFLSGFCIVIPRQAWDRVGEFDEQFFPGNFEDNDWCDRARDAGYALGIVPGAFVHHHGSATYLANRLDLNKAMQESHAKYEAKHPGRLPRYA